MKFDFFAFNVALDVALFVWSLASICIKLHISRSEVLFGKAEVKTTLRGELFGLIFSALMISYFLISRLNL